MSVFNRTILYMILFINIYMTYLIFSKFFKCTFVILIGYFLYIEDRLFKYLFLGIFIICQYFFKLLFIILVMNFAFVNIFYLNKVSFGVDNVKTINGTYSLTIMAEDFSNYGQEVFISVSVTPENTTPLDYILCNYLILTLIYFSTSIFCKNRVLNFSKLFISIFVIFLCFCKAPNNSTDSDLKSCSKFEFYSSESLKLQENLNNVNRNTSLAYFTISKLRNKPKHFLKFYQILLLLSGDTSLTLALTKCNSLMRKHGSLLKSEVLHFCYLNVNS